MGILSTLLGGSTQQTAPAINPSDTDALDAPVLPLMFLETIGTDGRGYRGELRMQLYVFFTEERLLEEDIQVSRYPWRPVPYGAFGGRKYPFTEQFKADMRRGFPEDREKPILRMSESTTFGGKDVFYYKTTEYTSRYIDEYFKHTTTDRETIQEHVEDVYSRISSMSYFDVADDILIEEHPNKYHY